MLLRTIDRNFRLQPLLRRFLSDYLLISSSDIVTVNPSLQRLEHVPFYSFPLPPIASNLTQPGIFRVTLPLPEQGQSADRVTGIYEYRRQCKTAASYAEYQPRHSVDEQRLPCRYSTKDRVAARSSMSEISPWPQTSK